MKLVMLVVSLLLGACLEAAPPPEPVPDQVAINAAIDAWRAVGLTYTLKCRDERAELTVDLRSDVMAVCGTSPRGIVIGCFQAPTVLVVTDDPFHRTETVVHEALHWLAWCDYDDSDPTHRTELIWETVFSDAMARVYQ